MSVGPAQPNIPEDDELPPDGCTAADPGPLTGRRRYVGRHRRAEGVWRQVAGRFVPFWPAALRTVLLLTILVTGTTAFAGPVGFGAQLLLIVLEVWFREG